MKAQNILIAHPSDDKELNIIKAFFEALKIKFEVRKDSPYDPDFVAMIKQGEEDLKNGKGIKMTFDELENLCK